MNKMKTVCPSAREQKRRLAELKQTLLPDGKMITIDELRRRKRNSDFLSDALRHLAKERTRRITPWDAIPCANGVTVFGASGAQNIQVFH